MEKEHKCGWTHCPYNKIIKPNEDIKKIGNRYYHAFCSHQKETIEEIVTMFVEQVNGDIVFTTLRGVVNTLIFKQEYDCDYVLYSIRYAVNHPEMKLTYPQGLYRVVKDKSVSQSWAKLKADKSLKEEKEKQKDNPIEIEEHHFTYKPVKEKTVANLFG